MPQVAMKGDLQMAKDKAAEAASNIIQVEAPKAGRSVEFEKEFGATLAESVERYTEEVVHSIFLAGSVIKCQGVVRGRLNKTNEAGEFVNTDEQAIDAGLAYVPQKMAARGKKDPLADIMKQIDDGVLTEDEAAKMLRDRIKAANAAKEPA